jgi:putative ATP-dependent endonuclease of OLD family
MKACRMRIRNFRSIEEVDLEIGCITRIVGANGAGKSTVLKALELFYTTGTPQLNADDFFSRDHSREIEITLWFGELDLQERNRFGSQVKSDGTLSVTRVFSSNPKASGKYYGTALRCAAFSGIRAVDRAADKKAVYNALRVSFDLPACTRVDEIDRVLAEWEAGHPEQCEETRDDGQFFGFQNVAQGKLADSTMLVYIPAVRDAAIDAADGRGSSVAKLLELAVKSAIEARSDIKAFRDDLHRRFRELMQPGNLTELGALAANLSETLKAFYANTSIHLNWRDAHPIDIPLPMADMRLDDEGFVAPVDRTGHGLQRALIVTLLQHLAIAAQAGQTGAASEDADGANQPTPNLILAIEEPELYQHPTKQRHLAAVLEKLALGEIPGIARSTQVIFTTHAPTFVSMERFCEVRLVRRHRAAPDAPRCCKISHADLDAVAKKLAAAWGRPEHEFTASSLMPRLHVVDGAVAEGFFAGSAVLVEGVSDRAAITAAAMLRGVDLAAEEIAILPVGGKSVLDKPFVIFRELGIPVFMMWDGDAGKDDPQLKINLALQRLTGVPDERLRDACDLLGRDHAAFAKNLEATLKAEIGAEFWSRTLDELRERYGLSSRSDAQKIPRLMFELLKRAADDGRTSLTLDRILDGILGLKRPSSPVASEAPVRVQEAA